MQRSAGSQLECRYSRVVALTIVPQLPAFGRITSRSLDLYCRRHGGRISFPRDGAQSYKFEEAEVGVIFKR